MVKKTEKPLGDHPEYVTWSKSQRGLNGYEMPNSNGRWFLRDLINGVRGVNGTKIFTDVVFNESATYAERMEKLDIIKDRLRVLVEVRSTDDEGIVFDAKEGRVVLYSDPKTGYTEMTLDGEPYSVDNKLR